MDLSIATPAARIDPRRTMEGLTERAKLLKAIADPTRLAVLDMLACCGTHCHCDLEELLDLPASRLSFHLKVLREVGLVTSAREGKRVRYHLVDGAFDRICDAVPRAGGGPQASRR